MNHREDNARLCYLLQHDQGIFKDAVLGEGRQMLFFCWLWLFANGAGAGAAAEKVMAGRSLTRRAAEEGGGTAAKVKSVNSGARTLPEKALGERMEWNGKRLCACVARARSVFVVCEGRAQLLVHAADMR